MSQFQQPVFLQTLQAPGVTILRVGLAMHQCIKVIKHVPGALQGRVGAIVRCLCITFTNRIHSISKLK